MKLDSLPSISSLFSGVSSDRVGKSKSVDLLDQLLRGAFPSRPARRSDPSEDPARALAPLGLAELDGFARSAQAFRLDSLQVSESRFSVAGDTFQAQGRTESARLEGSFQSGDQSYKFTLEVERTVVGIAYQSARNAGDPLADVFGKLFDDLTPNKEQLAQESRQQDFFSPDAVADRLAQLALDLGNAGQQDQDPSGSQGSPGQKFLDMMGQARWEEGFRRAEKLLGPLPDSIEQAIQRARGLLQQALGQGEEPDSDLLPASPVPSPPTSPAGRA